MNAERPEHLVAGRAAAGPAKECYPHPHAFDRSTIGKTPLIYEVTVIPVSVTGTNAALIYTMASIFQMLS